MDDFFAVYTDDEKPIHDCLTGLVPVKSNQNLLIVDELLDNVLHLGCLPDSMKSFFCTKYRDVLNNYNFIQLRNYDNIIEISPSEGHLFTETGGNGEYVLQLPSEEDISLFQV